MEQTEYEAGLAAYMEQLRLAERSEATMQQYRRALADFFRWLDGRPLEKRVVIAYKEALAQRYCAGSVNVRLAAINGFLAFAGRGELRVKQLRIQKKIYCAREKELSRAEYLRLVQAARQQQNEKLAMLLQTICGTGIRVSELRFITAEAVRSGEAKIRLKGKNRTVLLPGKLREALRRYLKQMQISDGPVFITRSGRPLDRSNIWKMMKQLCFTAGVDAGKVFPHNLRHLFARLFYAADKDIARLADILGHSSVNTTRIYIISSGREHRRRMDALGLVV